MSFKKNDLEKLNQMLEFRSIREKSKFEEELLSLRFIAVIEGLLEQKEVNRTELSKILDSSKSYVSQLFSGNKMLNIRTLAKIQRALDVSFRLDAVDNKRFQFEKVPCSFTRKTTVHDFVDSEREQLYSPKRLPGKEKIPA